MTDEERYETNYKSFVELLDSHKDQVSILRVVKNDDASFYLNGGVDDFDVIYAQLTYTAQKILSNIKTLEINKEVEKIDNILDVGSDFKHVLACATYFNCFCLDPVVHDNKTFEDLGISFFRGEAQEIPFEDNYFPIVTSLHAIEHFGLGRYGDTIDPRGDIKGLKEMNRVLKPGGIALLGVPITTRSRERVVFNVERLYSVSTFNKMLKDAGFEGSVYRSLVIPAVSGTFPSLKPNKFYNKSEINLKNMSDQQIDDFVDHFVEIMIDGVRNGYSDPTRDHVEAAYFVAVKKCG